MGRNDSMGVLLTWDGTPPRKSFCSGMERLQGSHSILILIDSRGVLLFCSGTTPGESFCPRMQRLKGRQSVLGWNDSRGFFH